LSLPDTTTLDAVLTDIVPSKPRTSTSDVYLWRSKPLYLHQKSTTGP
jgi:hypothetical protein